MKRLSLYLMTSAFLLLGSLALQSCLDDWDSDSGNSYLAIGTLKIIQGKDYYFNLDDGNKMYPSDTTYVHNYTLVDGQRAFIYYRPLDEKISGYEYNAQIYEIENILTKDIIPLTTATADSIGDDPIDATDIWITGNYLNINYRLYHSNNADKKHMLNLVVNQTATPSATDAGYVDLEFRHNAHNDAQRVIGSGVVSFKLDAIANQLTGKKGIKIRVKTIHDGIRYMPVDF